MIINLGISPPRGRKFVRGSFLRMRKGRREPSSSIFLSFRETENFAYVKY